MTRLIASLFVALALIAAPLALSNAAAAMPAEASCAAMETDAGCPDMERDNDKSCAQGDCISVCAPACLLPAANERQQHSFAASIFSRRFAPLIGVTPEAEPHPPRNISEM